MITLIVIGLLGFVSCIASAGLIVSTHDSADAARTMAGREADPDGGA